MPMKDDSERIKYAQWVLERTLAAIGAAEVKLGIIITINLAMLASMDSVFKTKDMFIGWSLIFPIEAFIGIFLSLFCCALVLIPRLQGPERSFIFFGRVGRKPQKDYFSEFTQAGEDAILDDLIAQIHINSQIACKKYNWIRASMIFSLLSILPWFLSMTKLMHN